VIPVDKLNAFALGVAQLRKAGLGIDEGQIRDLTGLRAPAAGGGLAPDTAPAQGRRAD
jgi:hypothetical protein